MKLLLLVLFTYVFSYKYSYSCDGMSVSVLSNTYLGNGVYEVTVEYCEWVSNGGSSAVTGIIIQTNGANILGTSTPSFTSNAKGAVINYSLVNSNTAEWGSWDNNPAVTPFLRIGDNTSILGNLLDNNNSNHNFYVLKTDSNGNFQWIKTIRGEGQVHGTVITVAKNGTSYFTGDFQLSVDSLAGSVITAEGFSSALVGKLDHNGELVWLEAIGGTGEDKGVDVLIDSLEAPIFLINSGENPYIGSIPVALNGFVEPLLVKLHPDNGALVWQQTISAQSPSGTVNPLGMTCFDGSIAIIGRNKTGLVFENTLYEAPYLRDFFIATVQDTTFLPVSTASLPDQQENQFTVFPNPSSASFHVAGANKLKQVEVYTTSGTLVQRISQPDNNLPFSFGETLYPGNYIFRMTDTEGYQYTVIGVKIQ